MPILQTARLVCLGMMVGFLWMGAAVNAEPPAGPAPADGGGAARQKTAAEAAQEERDRAFSDAVKARDEADLTRAAYEKANKPGPVPDEARSAFAQVVAAYSRVIDRPLASPDVIKIVGYCHLRLAGAYQYTGQFDKAIDQGKQAAKACAGTAGEIDATYAVGLMYLQAVHDSKQALTWLKRAQTLAQTILPDPNEQAKWLAATGEAIQRCEQEAK